MKVAEMMLDKQTDIARRVSKETGAAKLRTGPVKGTRASSRTREFWRVLSSAALSSPQAPVLRRLHD
jgi:hypothetical protein